MSIDVVVVADRARISLGCALNILVCRRTFPTARFHIAIPEDSAFESNIAQKIIEEHAASVYTICAPSLVVEGRHYRIENKINALRYFGKKPAILADSDLIFLRQFPSEYLFRNVPCSVPEHGLHEFPWERLFTGINLNPPKISVLLGSGEVSSPWFNGGFVVCPDAECMGETWRMMADYINRCDWVPEKFPYLDQISLPLAFAQLSQNRTVGHEHILASRFNQNLFYWSADQSYARDGFVAHHHNRMKLVEKYFSKLMMWVRDIAPEIDEVIEGLKAYDRD